MNEELNYTEPQAPDTAMEEAKAEAERPEWLPEKFKSPEDLAKSYEELEKKVSAGEKEETTSNFQEIMNSAREAYEEHGEISEEILEQLEAAGIPKDMVGTYVEGVKALSERELNSIYEAAGGKAQYDQVVAWASENLDDDEIEAFNSVVDSGNDKQIRFAIKSLAAQYKAASSKPVEPESQGSRAPDVFKSMAEVREAMADVRYKSGPKQDPAYIREVENKLSRSTIPGFS